MKVDCEFISGGCNALYQAMDFCQFEPCTHLIAYPCSNSVLIYDTKKVKILSSFSVFNARVNFVRFLDAKTIIAADGEGKIVIFSPETGLLRECKLKDSISAFSVIGARIIALSIDGKVTVLDLSLALLSEIDFGNNVMEALDSVVFANRSLVALSGVDNSIHLYELVDTQLEFRTSVKGHTRQVNALAFTVVQDHLLLASGAKDTYVRIWKIYATELIEPKVKRFKLDGQQFAVKLDSVLQGHAEEVSSLAWADATTLASGSFDFNIIVWSQDKDTQVWISSARLGMMSGNKNQIFGICYTRDRMHLAAYTLVGAIYFWKKEQEYRECPIVTGHYGKVTDLDFKEAFVVSCGLDQTTRLFGRWVENGTYHELARPQIHGYDLNAVRVLGDKHLISGGDEKILRIFNPTAFVVNQLNYLSGLDLQLDDGTPQQIVQFQGREVREFKLSNETVTQALGLMNIVPQFEEEEEFLEQDPTHKVSQSQTDSYQPNVIYGQPPSDALLVAKSLWPEVNKLYGHGYAISCIDTFGDIAASASTAITEKAAEIIIWDTKTFKIKQQLPCHSYTVQMLRFSQSGRYLASVSKDRCLGLFEVQDGRYELKQKSKQCSRVVYCCAFANQETLILTGSRDKKLRIYEANNVEVPVKEVDMNQEITALDTTVREAQILVGLGLGNGDIELWVLDELNLRLAWKASQWERHSKQVNQLRFVDQRFATCSDDHTVRVFEIK